MKPARIIVLVISVVTGGIAAYLASGDTKIPMPMAQMSTVEVLVANSDIGLGQKIAPGSVEWQAWPASSATSNFIRRADRPDATTQLEGSIVRAPFVAGEPIRDSKLITKGSGFMAAILPSGMRAMSTRISPETGAGGFILPNDRVDVILSRKDEATGVISSNAILNNLRVLAIDQTPKESDGQNSVIGRTATLETSLEQAEILARSHMNGTLSLALRSITDEKKISTSTKVAVYRGVESQSLYSCTPVCDRQ